MFENKLIGNLFPVKKGADTGNNDLFLKMWHEVNIRKSGLTLGIEETKKEFTGKWVPYNKGGEFRKWYGNLEYFINWENDGYDLKNSKANLRSPQLYFRDGITWNALSSSKTSARKSTNSIFDSAGSSMFPQKEEIGYYLAFMNSKIVDYLLKILNPTLNYGAGTISNLPDVDIKKHKEIIKNKSQQNISISKEEWDSRETSWDFERSSLIDDKDLKTAYENYCSHWRDNFVQLHKNEEELNRLFIEIYELQDEMDEKVSFDDITILKKEAKIVEIDNSIPKNFSSSSEKYLYDRGVSLEFNKDELVKQFLSYAIGCIMGRYSIDKPGLIMANSDDVLELSSNKFLVKDANGDIRQEVKTEFLPDEFGILPITAEKDFSNDIVERVKEFVKFVYGEESLKDNLNFIAEALGNNDNKNPKEIIRGYFIKDFYKDHLQRYQKRPIYWLMSSGNAFSCLFYIHRYEPLTVARVRADYLIHYQEMLENSKKFIERQLYAEDITAKEKKNIPLDLDDGVNVNYERLRTILKKR